MFVDIVPQENHASHKSEDKNNEIRIDYKVLIESRISYPRTFTNVEQVIHLPDDSTENKDEHCYSLSSNPVLTFIPW